MRDVQVVEEELVEIAAIPDDAVKLERIIAWSAIHPDELGFALRYLSGRSKGLSQWIQRHTSAEKEPSSSGGA